MYHTAASAIDLASPSPSPFPSPSASAIRIRIQDQDVKSSLEQGTKVKHQPPDNLFFAPPPFPFDFYYNYQNINFLLYQSLSLCVAPCCIHRFQATLLPTLSSCAAFPSFLPPTRQPRISSKARVITQPGLIHYCGRSTTQSTTWTERRKEEREKYHHTSLTASTKEESEDQIDNCELHLGPPRQLDGPWIARQPCE